MTNYEMAKATGFEGTFEEWNERDETDALLNVFEKDYNPMKELDKLTQGVDNGIHERALLNRG